jgi:pimeloyl-ACP methyl ester carboxylesterase
MSDILLVHGSCHGAWAWDRVIPELAALGLAARAIDLPGRNGAATTLEAQASAILEKLSARTVLVGHSAGGYPISLAAELADAGTIAGLIYVCAYIPQAGRSVADLRRAGPSQPLRAALRVAADRQSYSFVPAACADLFFHDCQGANHATARLCAEPIAPQETALPDLVRARALPRAAILCTNDRAIPPEWQAEMANGMPRYRLASSHSPFLSMPKLLAQTIAELCSRFQPGADKQPGHAKPAGFPHATP